MQHTTEAYSYSASQLHCWLWRSLQNEEFSANKTQVCLFIIKCIQKKFSRWKEHTKGCHSPIYLDKNFEEVNRWDLLKFIIIL